MGALIPNVPLMEITPSMDAFFMQFGIQANAQGFSVIERLVPPSFPVPAGNVVYRYRHPETATPLQRSTLLQIGPGVFSCNGLPPYKSWTEFAPSVKKGLTALLASRLESEKNLPFQVSLRYVDAFSADYCGGDFVSLMRDVLGFKVEVHPVFERFRAPQSQVENLLVMSMPLANGMSLSTQVGPGQSNGRQALLMNTLIATERPINPNVDELMEVLSAARNIIHDIFVAVTEPLHNYMDPK